jgi:hypothetical protein
VLVIAVEAFKLKPEISNELSVPIDQTLISLIEAAPVHPGAENPQPGSAGLNSGGMLN